MLNDAPPPPPPSPPSPPSPSPSPLDAEPPVPPAASGSSPPPRWSTRQLMRDGKEAEITHAGGVYRLRITSLGRLILTK